MWLILRTTLPTSRNPALSKVPSDSKLAGVLWALLDDLFDFL